MLAPPLWIAQQWLTRVDRPPTLGNDWKPANEWKQFLALLEILLLLSAQPADDPQQMGMGSAYSTRYRKSATHS